LEYIGHVGWRALMALMALMADDVTCCDISLPYQVFGLLVMLRRPNPLNSLQSGSSRHPLGVVSCNYRAICAAFIITTCGLGCQVCILEYLSNIVLPAISSYCKGCIRGVSIY